MRFLDLWWYAGVHFLDKDRRSNKKVVYAISLTRHNLNVTLL